MPIARFTSPVDDVAPFYSREVEFRKVYSHENKGLRLSVWFDGFSFTPLVERLDVAGVPVKGRILRENVRLVKAIKFAEDWIQDNLA